MITKNALTVLEKRYLRKDEQGNLIEQPEDMFRRVAEAVAQAETAYGKSPKHVEGLAGEFYQLMSSLEFLPNSPTMMNAGRDLGQLRSSWPGSRTAGTHDAMTNSSEVMVGRDLGRTWPSRG